MKKVFLPLLLICLLSRANAQTASKKYIGLAFMNTQSDLPFGKFSGMFYKAFHPGAEFVYGCNFSVKKKHDWYWDFRLGYFYHRFVQHGIPLYSNLGYRYKFNGRFSVTAEAGAGYLHSIPATAKLKLNSEGNYENNKGVGRAQANACFGLGGGYIIKPAASLKLFINYQQLLQMPFVKSYVPVLPYNRFMIGISKAIRSQKKK